MSSLKQSKFWYAVPALAAVGSATALFAAAEVQASVSVQTLTPVMNGTYQLTEDARGRFEPESSEWSGDRFFFNGQYNFVDDPLVKFDENRDQKVGTVVDSIHTLNLTGGVFFRPGLSIGATLPMNLSRPYGSSGRFALGDSRLQAKFRLTAADSRTHFSVAPELSVPTGSEADYLSSGTLGTGLLMSLERDFGRLSVALNLGYRLNPGARYETVDYRQMIPLGIGAHYRLSERWGVNAEAGGAIGFPIRPFNNPGDFYLGGRYQFNPGVALSSGAAFRSLGTGSDGHFRWIVGFSMSPQPKAYAEKARTDRVVIHSAATEACGIRPYTATFAARPLSASEFERFRGRLPYRSARHAVPALQIGQKTGIAQKGIPYVKDAQVMFAVDLTNLPPAQAVVKAENVAIKLNVTKVSSDPYTNTELLCLLEERVCSGDVYEDPKWVDSINPAFFRGDLPRNRSFSRRYLTRVLDRVGSQRLYSSEVTLEFNQLLAAYSEKGGTMGVLYRGARSDQPVGKKTLYFTVADDTYVGSGDAQVVVNLTEDTCKTLELTQNFARPTIKTTTTIETTSRKGKGSKGTVVKSRSVIERRSIPVTQQPTQQQRKPKA
ncbi:MAG: hypothetical protein IT285_01195 [Bdellovibrionales bacterium]|nr:hypothetical protein [Bdellovibrionales bacterium]